MADMDQQTSLPQWSDAVSHDEIAAFAGDFNFLEDLGDDVGLGMLTDACNGPDTLYTGHENSMHATDIAMEDFGSASGADQTPAYTQSFSVPQDAVSFAEGVYGSVESPMKPNMAAHSFQQGRCLSQMNRQLGTVHGYYGSSMVPQTPSSLEMHGNQVQCFQSTPDFSMQNVYSHSVGDQIIFTPLMSPAVAPLDAQFLDLGLGNDCFSPNASPGIQAQKKATHVAQFTAASQIAPVAVSSLGHVTASAPATPAPFRKTKRRQSNATRGSARVVRQSPAMKPQNKRNKNSSTVILPKVIDAVIKQAEMGKLKKNSPREQTFTSEPGTSSSEQDSVSPEALSEALMPPPAIPRCTSTGLFSQLSTQISETKFENSVAATPTSLMKIRKRSLDKPMDISPAIEQTHLESKESTDFSLEDFSLPGPANTWPASSTEATPTINAQSMLGSGVKSATVSVAASPRLEDSSCTNGLAKRSNRGRKRSVPNSVHVSPAIMPKISPTIQPKGAAPMSAEASAAYLASKSNYERIISGQHMPGISYPESLTTNLTSKRTSHKLAEQGRRNRINNALKEMESLLPSPVLDACSSPCTTPGSKDQALTTAATQASQQSSKAMTVEKAIHYIKDLKKQLEIKELQLQEREFELQETKEMLKVAKDSQI